MVVLNWVGRLLWAMLAVSAIWVLFVIASDYMSCRGDGTGKLWCLLYALLFGLLHALGFALSTVLKLIALLLP